MAELQTIILFDRTRVEKDWNCPRERYHSFEFGGRGLSPVTAAFDLELGTILHTALEQFARTLGEQRDVLGSVASQVGQDVRDLAERHDYNTQRIGEWSVLAEGLIRGFYRSVWRRLMGEYEIIAIEPECLLPLNGCTFMSRPDLVLRHRRDGFHVYIDYKSTSYNNEKWINSWAKKIQLHTGMAAASNTLGVDVEYAIVIGLYKGYEKYDRRNSAFTYGQINEGQPSIIPDQYSYEYMRGKGWSRFAVWEHRDGISWWVNEMPEEALVKNFPETPLIPMRQDMVQTFMQQRATREADIRGARQLLRDVLELPEEAALEASTQILDRVFPQNFDRCEPAFGHACNYVDACWQSAVAADPLGSGRFVWREPHHQPEIEQTANTNQTQEDTSDA